MSKLFCLCVWLAAFALPLAAAQGENVVGGARGFGGQHRDDCPERLAVLSLKKGYDGYNPQVINSLLRAAKAGPLPCFEEFLLRSLADDGSQDMVFGWGQERKMRQDVEACVQYLAVRGDGAKEFSDKFLDKLAAMAQGLKVPESYPGNAKEKEKRLELVRKRMQEFADIVRAARADVLAVELLSTYTDKGSLPGYGRKALEAKLVAMGPDEALAAVLRQAVAAGNSAEQRILLAKLLFGLIRDGAMRGVAAPAPHAKLWRALLDDHQRFWRSAFQVSDYYLALGEALFSSPRSGVGELGGDVERGDPSLALVEKHQAAGRRFLLKRALARLDGTPEKDLLPWPTGSADAGALRRKLLAVGSREEAQRLGADLSLEELELLPEVLAGSPALNVKFTAYANVVVSVDCRDDTFRQEFLAWKGRVVTPELVDKLQALCRTRTMGKLSVDCRIERQSSFGGCRLLVEPKGNDPPPLGYLGLVALEGVYGMAYWRVAPAMSGKPRWSDVLTSSQTNLDGFAAAVAAFCSGEAPASSPGLIRFLSIWERWE